MISRTLLRRPLRPFCGLKLVTRPTNSVPIKQDGWYNEQVSYIKNQANLWKTAMVAKSKLQFHLPFRTAPTLYNLSLSDVAGHASFILLAISYLESDFLQLRLFATSGITFSIIFQYYREKPLWLPIGYNSVFLLINLVMILMLLKEENDANSIPVEKKTLYENTFMKKGMKPVDFLHLISLAQRMEAEKGDTIVSEHTKNTRVYLVKSGKLSMYKTGGTTKTINQNQFAGSMSFLKWEDKIDTAKLIRKQQKDQLKTWSNINSDTELFYPLLIITEAVFDRLGIPKWPWLIGTKGPISNATVPVGVDAPGSIVQADTQNASYMTSILTREMHDDATYGVMMDENGNVIHTDCLEHSFDDEKEVTVVRRYLNNGVDFLNSLVGLTNAEHHAQGDTPDQAPAQGYTGMATVVAEEDCVLYSWSFESLRTLIEQHPSLGLAFERALSDDLHIKMNNSLQAEPSQRYQLMLSGSIIDGEASEANKAILAEFRQKHNISQKDHADMLQSLGWTAQDFAAGFKGAPSVTIQEQYQSLLTRLLSGTNEAVLSDEKRTELRLFRKKNGINSSAHMCALKRLGWTVDEYEIGSKNPMHASQKENRAIAVHERTERRGRIRAAVLSYVFPDGNPAPKPQK